MQILIPKDTNQIEFVNFWSRQYNYPNEHIYNDNISKELTEKRILQLFRWKNGTKLSALKETSVRKNYVNSTTVFP